MQIKRMIMIQMGMDSFRHESYQPKIASLLPCFYYILPIRSILSKAVFGRDEHDEPDAQSV